MLPNLSNLHHLVHLECISAPPGGGAGLIVDSKRVYNERLAELIYKLVHERDEGLVGQLYSATANFPNTQSIVFFYVAAVLGVKTAIRTANYPIQPNDAIKMLSLKAFDDDTTFEDDALLLQKAMSDAGYKGQIEQTTDTYRNNKIAAYNTLSSSVRTMMESVLTGYKDDYSAPKRETNYYDWRLAFTNVMHGTREKLDPSASYAEKLVDIYGAEDSIGRQIAIASCANSKGEIDSLPFLYLVARRSGLIYVSEYYSGKLFKTTKEHNAFKSLRSKLQVTNIYMGTTREEKFKTMFNDNFFFTTQGWESEELIKKYDADTIAEITSQSISDGLRKEWEKKVLKWLENPITRRTPPLV